MLQIFLTEELLVSQEGACSMLLAS